jgi:hypothetical protein
MPVPQGIPLALFDDRDDRVVLQQQNPAGAGHLRASREGAALIGFVHDAEAVQHHVRPRRDGGEPPLGEQWNPCTAVRAAELEHGVPPQKPVRFDFFDSRLGLVFERLRLHAADLVGESVVVGELGQAADAAQIHRQRVGRLLRAHGVSSEREVVSRRHLPEIDDPAQIRLPAPAARNHDNISRCALK